MGCVIVIFSVNFFVLLRRFPPQSTDAPIPPQIWSNIMLALIKSLLITLPDSSRLTEAMPPRYLSISIVAELPRPPHLLLIRGLLLWLANFIHTWPILVRIF